MSVSNEYNALSCVLKIESNIRVINNLIKKQYSDDKCSKRVTYQVIGDILDNMKLKDIVEKLKSRKYNWNHHSFDNEKYALEEQDRFIEHPFEVEEGVVVCKCGCKRVYSYSKQSRSADEPATTYAHCTSCGRQWNYSG
jgi:DNA-directed RNA polymerase subunit M/transcription elongation factor TFIIS